MNFVVPCIYIASLEKKGLLHLRGTVKCQSYFTYGDPWGIETQAVPSGVAREASFGGL